MLVSRKNLSLIQLIAGKAATGSHVPQALHAGVKFLCAAGLVSELFEPLAKGGIEGLVLGAGDGASLFDEILIGAKG
jgi:hypothetical protein